MATVNHFSFGWVGSPATDLFPREVHTYELGGSFKLGDAIVATALPVFRPGRALAVERVKMICVSDLIKLSIDIRNVGTIPVPGYRVGVTWVRQ
jgi:hypothetical protein